MRIHTVCARWVRHDIDKPVVHPSESISIVKSRVGIYTSFGPSIPVYTCIYTDTRIYGLNTYDD